VGSEILSKESLVRGPEMTYSVSYSRGFWSGKSLAWGLNWGSSVPFNEHALYLHCWGMRIHPSSRVSPAGDSALCIRNVCVHGGHRPLDKKSGEGNGSVSNANWREVGCV
jgi:hypothetical protein